MAKVIFISGKQGTGKTTLKRRLGAEDDKSFEVTPADLTDEWIAEVFKKMNDEQDCTYFYECQEIADNINLGMLLPFSQNFTWYECYGFRGNDVVHDSYPFLPF